MSTDTETVDFDGLSIAFDPRVLRPRSWTAHQSWWAADLAADAPPGPLLELCSGAGQIGLLAARASGRDLVCVDADPVAAAYGRANAAANDVGVRVEVREGAFTDVLHDGELFPVVIADPPWVRSPETGRFPEDPLTAIDGGADGLAVARACVATIGEHLAPGGAAVLQLGSSEQADSLRRFATACGLHLGEVREHGDRGVLVLLDRSTGTTSATSASLARRGGHRAG